MEKLDSRCVRRTYSHSVDRPMDDVFPLLCPVAEFDWLATWQCQILHSESGKVEKGCVFATEMRGEEPSIWVVSRHDPKAHVGEFVTVTPGSRVRTLEIALSERTGGGTLLTWSHTFVTLGPAGEDVLAGFTPEAYLESMDFVARSLEYYCRNGQRLEPSSVGAEDGTMDSGFTIGKS